MTEQSSPQPAPEGAPPPPARRVDEGPRFAYAIDTLLIEVARLNRVIRRIQETPAAPAERAAQARTVTQLMRRVVGLLEAIDALGAAQGGSDDPADGE